MLSSRELVERQYSIAASRASPGFIEAATVRKGITAPLAPSEATASIPLTLQRSRRILRRQQLWLESVQLTAYGPFGLGLREKLYSAQHLANLP